MSAVPLAALRSLVAVFLLSLVLAGRAADAKAEAADPIGTWKWGYAVGPDSVFEAEIRLRLVDTKLAGVAVGPDRKELPLEKIEFKDGRLRFEVTREVGGKRFKTYYEGTITGDQITGKASSSPKKSKQSRDWEAVRVRE